ncbi:MAG TPA: hypothetical protein VFZ16_22280 [Hyphomicrobiaceae bacterium]|nr:hypothetical protein [Hyphomicrobiaceae bacterium]
MTGQVFYKLYRTHELPPQGLRPIPDPFRKKAHTPQLRDVPVRKLSNRKFRIYTDNPDCECTNAFLQVYSDFPIKGNRGGNIAIAIAVVLIFFWAVVMSRLLGL